MEDFLDSNNLNGLPTLLKEHDNPLLIPSLVTNTSSNKRIDGREAGELRQFDCSFSVLSNSNGSVKLSFGDTVILCGVEGPIEPERIKDIKIDKTSIVVELIPSNSLIDHKHASMALKIQEILEKIIILEKYPRTCIKITIQIQNDDGSMFSIAFNSALLALIDAGIPMKTFPIAIQCALLSESINKHNTNKEKLSQPILYIDPNEIESKISTSEFTFILLKDINEENKDLEVLSIDSNGIFLKENIDESLTFCKPFANILYNLFKEIIQVKLSFQD